MPVDINFPVLENKKKASVIANQIHMATKSKVYRNMKYEGCEKNNILF